MKSAPFHYSVYMELDGCKPEDYSYQINKSGITAASCYVSLELKTKDSQQ